MNTISNRQEFRALSDRLLQSDQGGGQFALWADRFENGIAELEVECRWSGRKALVQFEHFEDDRSYCHIIPVTHGAGIVRGARVERAWWTSELHDLHTVALYSRAELQPAPADGCGGRGGGALS